MDGLNLVDSDVQMVLLVGAPTLTQNIRWMSELTDYENDDATYSRQSLTNKEWAWDSVNMRLEFFHDNVDFGMLEGDPPTYAVYIIDRGGADSANDVLGYFDIPDVTPSGNNPYVVTVGSQGAIWL